MSDDPLGKVRSLQAAIERELNLLNLKSVKLSILPGPPDSLELIIHVLPEAVIVASSKEQQDIDDVFGSLISDFQEDPKIEQARNEAHDSIRKWLDE